MTHDFYRPAACHRMRGAVNQAGHPLLWSHTITSTSIGAFWGSPDKLEESEVGGAKQMPYTIRNVRLEYSAVPNSVPPLWWRSVEHSFNGFAVECFIDELAAAAGRDPVEFRRGLLVKPANWKPKDEDDPDPARLRGVLDLAAEKVGWSKPLPKGKGRGIASYHSFGSYIAEAAEVTVTGKDFKIDRIIAAIDCGQVVNPESVRAQAESAIIYGLSAALKNEITIKDGAVEQSNFDGYDPIRIDEAPPIEVHILKSKEDPGGMGEPALPPAAPAVAWAASNGDRSDNADYRYGKRRLRQIDGRIRFLTKRIEAAEVVDPEAPRSGQEQTRAFFGATVRYANGAGAERVVSIVGTDEVDLNRNQISWVSPLGRALMKSAAGDSVVLQAPGGTEYLTVLEVCYERIDVEPFREPPGSEASAKRLPR